MTPYDVRAFRTKLGLTQKQCELLIGLSGDGSTVKRWEAGTREVSGPCALLMRMMLEER